MNTMNAINILILLSLLGGSYLLGSLSSAILICQLFRLPDPRTTGSQNPGATNVLRIAGKSKAAMVLFGDVFKGLLPVLLIKYVGHESDFIAGIIGCAAVLGHIFPVFYRFQGGKGVATVLGVYFGLSSLFGLACGLTWLIIFKGFRYSSLSSLIMVILAPVYAVFLLSHGTWFPLLFLAILIIYKHRANMERLYNGTESKFSKK